MKVKVCEFSSPEFKPGDILVNKHEGYLYLYTVFEGTDFITGLNGPNVTGKVFRMMYNWKKHYKLFNGKITISNDFVDDFSQDFEDI